MALSIFQTVMLPSSPAVAKQDFPRLTMDQMGWLPDKDGSNDISRAMVSVDRITNDPSARPTTSTGIPASREKRKEED